MPPSSKTQPGQLTTSSTRISFGNVQIGENEIQALTLTNSGGSNLIISQATASGTGFTASGLTFPLTLTTGESKALNVTFAPQSSGNRSGNLQIGNNGSTATVNVALSGAGISGGAGTSGGPVPQGTLTPNTTSLSFGTVQSGRTLTISETLTNTGTASLNITEASVAGTGFGLSGINLPLTLAVNQSTSFSVTFTPKSTGDSSGNVAITNNGSSSTVNIALAGIGTSTSPNPRGKLTVNPTSLNFGSVQTGKNLTISEMLTNTGAASLNITQASVTGKGFGLSGINLPLTLAVNQSTSFSVTFAPKSTGESSGSVAITANGSNSTVKIALAGSGTSPGPNPQGTLTVNPTSLNFGSVPAKKNLTLPEYLTNTGNANLTVSQANVTGSAFTISGLDMPLVLAPGQSFTFGVIFAPQTSGNQSGVVSLASDASDPSLTVPVGGTAPDGQLSVVPSSINLGNVTVGSQAQQNGQLGASGASVTVSSVNVQGSEFAITGITFPITIPAGQSANFTATFTPQTPGQASVVVNFASDASDSPTVQSLTGNGVSAPHHQVVLSWDPSSSSNVVGYNVYRGTQQGGPYPTRVASMDPDTTYTDSSVASGQTYYYVATSVNAKNVESVDSSEVKVVVPSP